MSKTTSIQWAHTTVNPVMGCDGCELYPSRGQIQRTISNIVCQHGADPVFINPVVEGQIVNGPQHVKLNLTEIALRIARSCIENDNERIEKTVKEIENAVAKLYVCYAASLHRFFNSSGTRAGYAPRFEQPTTFAGRVEKVSLMSPPSEKETIEKPWLSGYSLQASRHKGLLKMVEIFLSQVNPPPNNACLIGANIYESLAFKN